MKRDIYLSIVLLLQQFVVIVQLILPLTGFVTEESAANYRVFITLVTYLPAAIMIFVKSKNSIIFPFLIYFVVLFLHYSFFPASRMFIESKDAFTLTPIAILSAVFIIEIKDFYAFHRVLSIFSYLNLIAAFIYVGVFSSVLDKESSYSMSFGYSLLFSGMYMFINPNPIAKICSFVMFVLILLVGSRGPIFVLSLFYVSYLVFFVSKKARLKIIIAILLFFGGAFLYLPQIVDIETSRTLSLISSNEVISHDSGRGTIYLAAENAILENPIMGCGIGSDRFLLKPYDQPYVHNILLELFIHYGLFIGSLLIVGFIVSSIRLLRTNVELKADNAKAFYISMLMCGIIPLFVSGSYLINSFFAMAIGYMIRLKNHVITTNLNKYERETNANVLSTRSESNS